MNPSSSLSALDHALWWTVGETAPHEEGLAHGIEDLLSQGASLAAEKPDPSSPELPPHSVLDRLLLNAPMPVWADRLGVLFKAGLPLWAPTPALEALLAFPPDKREAWQRASSSDRPFRLRNGREQGKQFPVLALLAESMPPGGAVGLPAWLTASALAGFPGARAALHAALEAGLPARGLPGLTQPLLLVLLAQNQFQDPKGLTWQSGSGKKYTMASPEEAVVGTAQTLLDHGASFDEPLLTMPVALCLAFSHQAPDKNEMNQLNAALLQNRAGMNQPFQGGIGLNAPSRQPPASRFFLGEEWGRSELEGTSSPTLADVARLLGDPRFTARGPRIQAIRSVFEAWELGRELPPAAATGRLRL